MNKSYKAVEPNVTINHIRNLIHNLGVFLVEEHFDNESLDLYSCRLKIANKGIEKLNIGVNGKGITQEYSLASAYGEFMERLQNQFLFSGYTYGTKHFLSKNIKNPNFKKFKERLEREDLILNFYNGPDEEYRTQHDIINEYENLLKKMLKLKTKDEIVSFFKNIYDMEELTCIPFYNSTDDKLEVLPINLIKLLTGSNGMCAGNTKEEALVQGICEIFERYVLSKIYADDIVPPTIPNSYFKGTKVYDKIKLLEEKYDASVLIKDCSLNVGLPVIGLVIINKIDNEYYFHLGADVSPAIALERCLTESFQGRKELLDFNNFDLGNIQDFKINDHNFNKNIRVSEHYKSVTTGNGHLPNNFFVGNETYSFNGFKIHQGKSDREDIKNLQNLISELGYKLYVRDVSFLNFPAFFLYIPGMSEINNLINNDFILHLNHSFHYQKSLHNIKSITNKKREEIAYFIEVSLEQNLTHSKFLYNLNEELLDLDKELLLVMLFYSVENYEKAYKFITRFLDKGEKEPREYLYYFCIKDLLYLKIKGYSEEEILDRLMVIYTEELSNEVIEDFSNHDEIFRHHKLPSCFNCESCEISSDCKYIESIKLIKSIHNEYEINVIDQESLKVIFN